jgi:hypothetical protein
VDILISLANESAKTVREAADAWLSTDREVVLASLRQQIANGNAGAVLLLWRIGEEPERELLRQRRKSETHRSIKEALDSVLADSVHMSTRPSIDLPPLQDAPFRALDAAARSLLDGIAETCYQEAVKQAGKFHRGPPPEPMSQRDLDRWFGLLNKPDFALEQAEAVTWFPSYLYDRGACFRPLLVLPDFGLGHVVRLAALSGLLHQRPNAVYAHGLFLLVKEYEMARKLRCGLRELAEVVRQVGLDPDQVCFGLLQPFVPSGSWADDEVWPYFYEHPEFLEIGLGMRVPPPYIGPWLANRLRPKALAILAAMPSPPPSMDSALWEIALGASKVDRPFAQQALGRIDGVNARILSALSDGKQTCREAAADWLGARADASAIVPLRAALKKEKNDRAKAAMMSALEALGASVDEFLDRKGLVKEAQKALAKGVPEALAWFPFERLPSLRWVDDGTVLDAAIPRFWILQANKLATPEPSPLLRRYATKLVAEDARALGRTVLEAWIAQDTATLSGAELDARVAHLLQQWGPSISPQQAQQMASAPKGSAIGHKGILAIAGAMAADTAAPLIARYLKDWYGMRAAHCKALLQMLSWVEHPSAIQVVLSTATRFRTAGIRKVAEECVHEIAERRGWTVDELADRTVPTAGLNDDRVIELSYGARVFRARLDDELSIALENDDGKPISNLPEPRGGDDEAKAGEAKQQLTRARKEVKTVVKQQRDRLYEAMCTQRRWQFADWQTYLLGHPIVGRLCGRVIWMIDGSPRAFRPLADGTLTGPDDGPLTLAEDARIGLAHPSLLSDELVAAWSSHLDDYEIDPLFDQLGRKPYRLAESLSTANELKDFEGHILEAFKLRGRATRLGYVRGPAEDGGWFHRYVKHFPGLGMAVEVEFTGNSLPEENRKVALLALRFGRTGEQVGVTQPVELADVPAVLLSECWNDVREIAAEGLGFDPEWQAKTSA